MVVERSGGGWEGLEIEVEGRPGATVAPERVLRRLEAALGLRIRLRILAPNALVRADGKSVRFVERSSEGPAR